MQSLLEKILARKYAVRHLVYFVNSAAIITPAKCYEISAMSIHSVVKLNFSRRSVCLHNALFKWSLMTSHNVTFIDDICALFHVALIKIQMRSLFGQFRHMLYFINQINVIFMRPLYHAVFAKYRRTAGHVRQNLCRSGRNFTITRPNVRYNLILSLQL